MSIDYELGADHGQQLELVHYRLNTLLVHHASFQHFLHSELSDFLSFESVAADAPHLSEASTADGVLVVKQVLVQSYRNKNVNN